MPASFTLLCAFIGEHSGGFVGGTVKNWMSGIQSWHVINHAPWEGDDAWVHLARVAANKAGTEHKRPLRAPVSIEHLLCLRKSLSLSIPFHAAVWAVATTAFFGCHRLGEVTIPSLSSFNPSFHVTRGTKVHFRSFWDGARSAHFRIPWTKTTHEDGFTVILTARHDELCPCAALENHLRVNHSIPSSFSLFAFAAPSGQPTHMLCNNFLTFINDIWSRSFLAHVLGHSFRIGGAVALLLAGVPPEVVAATGGWASLAFLLYWRRMEEILPMSTSKAYNKSHLDSLAAIFENFRVSHKLPLHIPDDSDLPSSLHSQILL